MSKAPESPRIPEISADVIDHYVRMGRQLQAEAIQAWMLRTAAGIRFGSHRLADWVREKVRVGRLVHH